MLGFFRKYQYYIYLVVTVVIVISFSFFGTYSALPSASPYEGTAFTAINGAKITRGQLERLVGFIKTDGEEKRLYGGMWGPNFLNDGVVTNDILKTGIGEVLLNTYSDEIKSDFERRFKTEQHYKPYVHPQAKFLGVENIWTYIAPDVKSNFEKYKEIKDPTSSDAYKTRIDLYLAQRNLPGHQIRGILRHQEKQYAWLSPDPNLDRDNLSIFGYNFAEDWFGQRFLRLAGEFIINSAIIAEKQGYQVTKEEAMQDLLRNAQRSFQENLGSQGMHVANYSQYMDEQLHRMGMDRSIAANIWRQVLLFRRLYQDVGHSVVVSPLPFEEFLTYSKESIKGDIYQVPQELQLNEFRDMQKLEIYLGSVAVASIDGKLKLPKRFKPVDKVSATAPELVQKRYLLDVAKVQKANLQSRISIKETWAWEVDDNNWAALKKRFPELGVKKANSREKRYAVLDSLDGNTRERVDTFARMEIVDSHPEWLQEALDKASPERMTISLRKRGGRLPFAGLKNGADLIAVLDKAPLGHEATNESEYAELKKYTADDKTYYQITVIDRSPELEIMTFAEANKEGVLDEMLDRKLEAYYISKRSDWPEGFKQPDGSWKGYATVKDKVGEKYFAANLKVLREYHKKHLAIPGDKGIPTPSTLAAERLHAHVNEVRDLIAKDPTNYTQYSRGVTPPPPHNTIAEREPLEAQWKLEKTTYHTDRSSEDTQRENTLFELSVNEWSKVYYAPNGETFFFHMLEKGEPEGGNSKIVAKKVREAQTLLSNSAQRALATQFIAEMKEKGAISIDFMAEPTEPEVEEEV